MIAVDEVTGLPAHTFVRRKYQSPFYHALVGDEFDNAMAVWHRRAGKDEVTLNALLRRSIKRIGTYWHCLPEYAQARKALWDAVNQSTGKRRLDEIFPPECIEDVRGTDMFVKFKWGSTFQLIGSDAYNKTVGAGPVWVSYSEWALANPGAFAYHQPMLLESRGKAVFITTPRGNNHAKQTYDYAVKSPRWFAQTLTVNDTGIFTQEQLDEVLATLQAQYGIDFGLAYFNQEYLCSFSGAMVGAYFGAEIARAEREGRITSVPVDDLYPVHTVWDLGKAVNNPIWCFQVIGEQLRIVDFYVPESDDIEQWVEWLNERGYRGFDYVPHDIVVTEWGTRRTRFETLVMLGRKPIRVAKVSVADGLQAGRTAINAAVFDAEATARGVEGLKSYRREWDDELKTFKENPVKDWAEHIGSAWRYLGLAWREVKPQPVVEEKPAPVAPPGHVLLHFPGPPEPVRRRRL